MPKTVFSEKEPEYGEGVKREQREKDQEAARIVGASQNPPLPQPPTTQAPPVAGRRVGNRMMLLPPQVNFPQVRGKTPGQRAYDAAMLFAVLAKDTPEFKIIADELAGS